MLTLKGAKRQLSGLAFAPDNRTLAVAGLRPGHVELWPLPAGGEPTVWLPGCGYTSCPRFSPDGRTLYCRTTSHPTYDTDPLAVRDVRTEADRPSPTDRVLEYVVQFDLTPDGKRLVTAGAVRPAEGQPFASRRTGYSRAKDGTLTPKWATVTGPDEHTWAVFCRPDARFVAWTNRYDAARRGNVAALVLADLATGAELAREDIEVPSTAEAPAASPGAEWLVIVVGYRLRVYDTNTLKLAVEIKNPQGQKQFTQAAFTPDGKHLLAAGTTGFVRAFAVGSWAEVKAWDWKAGPLTCVGVSPDGTLAACGTKTGTVVVWDVDL